MEDEFAAACLFPLLAVFWDYLWFVLNPAYTVKRFERGKVWWFEVPWLRRFPRDYYSGVALSIVLAGVAAWIAGEGELLYRHLWTLAGLIVLTGLAVLAALPTGAGTPHAPRRRRRPFRHAHVPTARAGCRLVGRRARPDSARGASPGLAFAPCPTRPS